MKILFTILLLVGFKGSSFAVSYNYRDSLVSFASTLTGVPYHYGGASEKGFDCSGFVYYVFKYFNQSVPRSSAAYQNFGLKVSIDAAKPGDVIVFTGTNSAIRKPGHVGIVYKNENGLLDFIHASSSRKNYGVTITRYNNSGYEKRFLSVISIFDE
ncbi:MAG: C40 family peptidase [Putridiphycobacter sp.]|nr:C40 family peptidase [Putridiphycobacter sp.]